MGMTNVNNDYHEPLVNNKRLLAVLAVMFRPLRRRVKLLLSSVFIIAVFVYFSGILVHPFERDYKTSFSYPIDRRDFPQVIAAIVDGENLEAGEHEPISPINSYDYRWIIKNGNKCQASKDIDRKATVSGADLSTTTIQKDSNVRLVLIIKSFLTHIKNRDVIRKTWGFEQRFSDVVAKRVFVVGSCKSLTVNPSFTTGQHMMTSDASCQESLDQENLIHGDIVQADFIDSYYNNTIKTMMGLKWLNTFCVEAEYALFVDDDYYVSLKNLLKFLRHPMKSLHGKPFPDLREGSLPPDGRLYAGYVFPTSSPMRHSTSKWSVSLKEYPFDKFPPYVTAGAYVLSNRAFREFSVASKYVQHFRFDDIYMGLLAKKIQLEPLHDERFLFWSPRNYDPEKFDSVIASHGFGDTEYLMQVWLDQKSRGHA